MVKMGSNITHPHLKVTHSLNSHFLGEQHLVALRRQKNWNWKTLLAIIQLAWWEKENMSYQNQWSVSSYQAEITFV